MDSDEDDYDYHDYYDYEDDDDDVLCSLGVPVYTGFNESKSFRKFENFPKNNNSVCSHVDSLLDLSAKVASLHYSYNYVERFHPQIPEPVAKKFMLWSFPRSFKELFKHLGSTSGDSTSGDSVVDDVMQIGFLVCGRCAEDGEEPCDVSLYIDRCVITSASCSCINKKSVCRHVLALAFYRLRHAGTIPIQLPISDSLNSLNREQLLYLVKYVINKHSNVLLPSAQDITNELLDDNSVKSRMPGAPDPTAGGDTENNAVWLSCN